MNSKIKVKLDFYLTYQPQV